jgi:hypothetical protein
MADRRIIRNSMPEGVVVHRYARRGRSCRSATSAADSIDEYYRLLCRNLDRPIKHFIEPPVSSGRAARFQAVRADLLPASSSTSACIWPPGRSPRQADSLAEKVASARDQIVKAA